MTHFHVSKEVYEAMQEQQAVVALESTIISHGMPYPQNVETALLVERTVREAGAIPATCAIIHGQLKAGLSEEEIELLGVMGQKIPKASRRDIPYLVSQGQHGATTVASTMIIAHLAGIKIFATGGIGGVHRGANSTMDISADLQELARTPVAVVSAGAKSILDIGLTLEYLETMGVPVVGYQTDEFPAFYTRKSGFGVDCRLETPKQIAKLLKAKWELNLQGAVLIANPVPEAHQMDAAQIEKTIEAAIVEADKEGIKGKAITPYLLAKIEKLSGGKSLETNIQLVLNNARLGAEIAKAMNNEQ
ncbi:MAG: pseudouridine-5'-phosphate glycosidase [Saprospiraceae bacterium]